MRFRDWYVISEAGHFIVHGEPLNFMAVHHGKMTPFKNVGGIDPKFEFLKVPLPPGHQNRNPAINYFLGDLDYSLPAWDATGRKKVWICSHRAEGFGSMMSGDGYIADQPLGYAIPATDWSDTAQVVTDDLRGP
jgi:hypothetical protein